MSARTYRNLPTDSTTFYPRLIGTHGAVASNSYLSVNAGVDVLTNGNHAWDKKEALEYISTEPRLLRPHNYPDGTPGTGWFVATLASGHRLGILNLMGNVFMHPHLACPFAAARGLGGQSTSLVDSMSTPSIASIVSRALAIAADLCIYTNNQRVIEVLE